MSRREQDKQPRDVQKWQTHVQSVQKSLLNTQICNVLVADVVMVAQASKWPLTTTTTTTTSQVFICVTTQDALLTRASLNFADFVSDLAPSMTWNELFWPCDHLTTNFQFVFFYQNFQIVNTHFASQRCWKNLEFFAKTKTYINTWHSRCNRSRPCQSP